MINGVEPLGTRTFGPRFQRQTTVAIARDCSVVTNQHIVETSRPVPSLTGIILGDFWLCLDQLLTRCLERKFEEDKIGDW
jgi:hypothetical protein